MTRSAVQSYKQISNHDYESSGHGLKIKRSSSAVSSRTIVIESRPLMLRLGNVQTESVSFTSQILTRPLTTVGQSTVPHHPLPLVLPALLADTAATYAALVPCLRSGRRVAVRAASNAVDHCRLSW